MGDPNLPRRRRCTYRRAAVVMLVVIGAPTGTPYCDDGLLHQYFLQEHLVASQLCNFFSVQPCLYVVQDYSVCSQNLQPVLTRYSSCVRSDFQAIGEEEVPFFSWSPHPLTAPMATQQRGCGQFHRHHRAYQGG